MIDLAQLQPPTGTPDLLPVPPRIHDSQWNPQAGQMTQETGEPQPTEELHTETGVPEVKKPMPQLDFATYPSQIFWLAITFVALYVILSRTVLPRIHDVLENRRYRITHDLDRAAQFKAEAEEARTSYEKALAEARAKSQQTMAELADSLHKTSEARNAELDKQLAAKISASEAEIQAARREAGKKLMPVSAEVAAAIVEKLANRRPSAEETNRLVNKLAQEGTA